MRASTVAPEEILESSLALADDMFNRTQNRDLSYNSRCLDCLMPIRQAIRKEDDLTLAESQHLCPERLLAESKTLREAPLSLAHLE